MLAAGVGLVVWKTKYGASHGGGEAGLTKISKEDMQFLLADANPMRLKQMSEDPEAKKKYTESLEQFLAVASEARKEGLADKYKTFLDFIRAQIVATNYDKEVNKDKGGALPPFSFIKKEDVDAYYQTPANEQDFNNLVKSLVDQGKEEDPNAPEPTPEQLQQLKDQYAKVKIYEKKADDEGDKLGEEFKHKTDLQVRLQQAALLNQIFAQKVLTKKAEVTDDEVKNYIASHPEYDPKEKKAKAEQILQRVKGGEDFAKVADEASEDPGNKDPKTGEKQGGLYKDVKPGSGFDKTFEETALSLQPGQVADHVVETPFGYHIIKLERKGPSKDKSGKDIGETYDVRHILISTMFTDPQNPFSQPMPVAEKVKADLQEEKSKKVLEEIKANNPITVEDFEVPKPTDEQIQQMMQRQQQMQMPPGMSPEDLQQSAPKGKEPGKPPAPKKK